MLVSNSQQRTHGSRLGRAECLEPLARQILIEPLFEVLKYPTLSLEAVDLSDQRGQQADYAAFENHVGPNESTAVWLDDELRSVVEEFIQVFEFENLLSI